MRASLAYFILLLCTLSLKLTSIGCSKKEVKLGTSERWPGCDTIDDTKIEDCYAKQLEGTWQVVKSISKDRYRYFRIGDTLEIKNGELNYIISTLPDPTKVVTLIGRGPVPVIYFTQKPNGKGWSSRASAEMVGKRLRLCFPYVDHFRNDHWGKFACTAQDDYVELDLKNR